MAALFRDLHDGPFLREIVNTPLDGDYDDGLVDASGRFIPRTAEGRHEALTAEPFRPLHGAHCYVEDAGYAVLVCGWPEEHINRSPING